MKKLFGMLALAGVMIACNDSRGNEEPNGDSTRLPSTVSPADTSTVPPDAPARVVDSVIKK